MTRAMWNQLTKLTDVSKSSIKHWESDWRHGLSLARKEGSGRPSVMTTPVVAALHKIAADCAWLGTNEYYFTALNQMGFKVSKSAVQRHIVGAGWKSGTASTVPILTAEDCRLRVDFCARMLASRGSRVVRLHGDEKVFTAEGMARQRAPPDVDLHRPGKSSQYKNKIMVWSVVGRPLPDYGFNGLMELTLIGRAHVATLNSKNHRKGDVYIKSGDKFLFHLKNT